MRAHSVLLLALGLALAVTLAGLRLADPAPVRDLRFTFFDYLQRFDPLPDAAVPVRVVDIDEASLAALGQWPWPRDRMARLTERLAGAGAAVVVHDILFAEPDRFSRPGTDNDVVLAGALATVPAVLGTARTGEGETLLPPSKAGFVEVGDAPVAALPAAPHLTPVLPGLADAAAGIGVISVGPDGGGPVRRLPLVWAGPDGPLPALSLEALRVATGETTVTLWGAPDLAGALEGVGLGELFIPTTASGELWLRYRRDDPSLYLSAREVLESPPAEWRDAVTGHIVLVGTSAAGLLDIRTTALGETVPGVSIHAQAIEQILLGTHLSRSDVTAGLEVLAILALAGAVTLAIAFSGPGVALGVGLIGAGGLLATSWVAFGRGALFDAAYPVLAGGLVFALLSAYRLVVVDRERRLIRRSFSHYVAPEVLGEIERSGHRLALGGEAREVTVLFCDIRGFTGLTETVSPEALVGLLNGLFDAFGEEVLAERGTIDKFIGDAVMAFWNAPLPVRDHPVRAVAAGLGMQRALDGFNCARPGHPPIRTAIGIATGPAFVGNIGSRNRFNYSVIGETVNLAARVEAACRHVGADMLVTEPVADAAPGLALLDAGRLDLRGVSEPVRAYAVAGGEEMARDPRFVNLVALHSRLIAALVEGSGPEPGPLSEAAALADDIHPGLAEFFEALPAREADYRDGDAFFRAVT